MNGKGWICIHRKIRESLVWQDKPFSKGQAWIDLLLSASHDDSKFLLGNEAIETKKGKFVTSELKLMERWGWGKSKVRAFLNLLEIENMIIKNSDRRKTTITIVKYSDYQDIDSDNVPLTDQYQTTNEPLSDQKQTDNRPIADHKNTTDIPLPYHCQTQSTIINNNNIYIDHFDAFWNAYPKKVGKAPAQKSFRKIKVNDKILSDMLSAIDREKSSKQWQDKQFIPNPATWLNQRRWEDETDELTRENKVIMTSDGTFKF